MPVAPLAAVLLSLAPPATVRPAEAAGPSASRLTVADEDRDIGVVAEGAPVQATFVLVNPGPGAVQVLGMSAGCACQTAAGLPGTLAAGGSATLRVSMRTKDRTGAQRGWWEVRHRTADGVERALRLALTAQVTAAGKLEPAPAVAQFGAVEIGEPVAAAVVLAEREASGEAVAVRGVQAPDWLAVRVRRAADGAARWRLELAGTPPGGPGRVAGTIRVQTDSPRYPLVEVPFEAFVNGRAALQPRSVVQVVGAAAAKPAAVTVRGRRGATVTGVTATLLADDDADGAGEAVSVRANGDGTWAVLLPTPPPDGARVERGTLRVEVTTDGGAERHALPALTLRPAGLQPAAFR